MKALVLYTHNLENKGITLIALVITIIILLILAGITISQLIGSGLFGKAEVAKQRTRYATAKEIIDLKLMEIQTDCISKGEEYNIVKIAEEMEKAENIEIEKYYNKETATIKEGVEKNLTNLEGIVVSVKEYSEYKFLIGKECQIKGVLEGEVTDTTSEKDFIDIEKFEENTFGDKVATDNIEYSYEKKKIEGTDKYQIIITIKDNKNGINKIEYPNGEILECNGKNEVGIDYTIEKEVEYKFKVISSNGYEKEIIIYEEEETLVLLTYTISDNKDSNNLKTELRFYNKRGIQKIEKRDGTVINAKGEKELKIDYIAKLNTEETFKVKLNDNTEVESKLNIKEEEYEFTNLKVDYKDKQETDKTYYKIGENGEWYRYTEVIKLDMAAIEKVMDTTGNQGKTIIHIKKENAEGNAITVDKEIEIKSTAYNVLSNIRYKGENVDEYITSNKGPNEFGPDLSSDNYLIHELGYGHVTGSGSYSAIFKLNYSNLGIKTANKLKVSFNHCIWSSNDWIQSTAKVYYTDGSTSDEKASEIEFYENWSVLNYTENRSSVILDLEESKTVDYIEMKINGYDSRGGEFFGVIRDIVFLGVSK